MPPSRSARLKRRTIAFIGNEAIFLGVILLCFIVIKIVPFLFRLIYSFTDWNGVSGKVAFIGLNNFQNMIQDKQFWASLWFTAKYSLATLTLTNFLGFFLGFFLTKPLRARNLIRAGFYLPNVLGGLVLGFIWRFIFLKIVPALGKATGFPLFNLVWLGTPETAFWALVIVHVWSSMGYYMLLYVAGFMSIPGDCLESARIDGASAWKSLIKVTVPLMMPTFTRCLFLSITTSFRIYNLNLALTEGGPFLSSEAVTMNIYRTAFTENMMGYGSAKSLVLSLIVIAITLVQVWATSRKEVEF